MFAWLVLDTKLSLEKKSVCVAGCIFEVNLFASVQLQVFFSDSLIMV